jgi:hypothetical protein
MIGIMPIGTNPVFALPNVTGIQLSGNSQAEATSKAAISVFTEDTFITTDDYKFNGKFLVPIASVADGSIPISDSAELAAIKDNPSGKYYLTADIDLGGVEWIPINNFSGILDGQGHVVKNMMITNLNTSIYGDNLALFGSMSTNASIKNVGIKDLSINIDSAGTGSGYCIGALCGFNGGTIDNCYVTGDVSIHVDSSSVGGISGVNRGSIFNCYNEATISVIGCGNQIGGIAGSSEYGSVSMDNCHNVGDISISAEYYDRYGGVTYAGGILGGAVRISGYTSNILQIADCQNTGNINVFSAHYSGGYYYNDYSVITGGIIGRTDFDSQIERCFNAGNIVANVSSESQSCTVYAGGIAGILDYSINSITDCDNQGNVSASSNSRSEGFPYYTISSNAYAGGICATLGTGGSDISQKVSNCHNTGNVSASATSDVVDTSAAAGGIVGRAMSGFSYGSIIIKSCSNNGLVYSSHLFGPIVGEQIGNVILADGDEGYTLVIGYSNGYGFSSLPDGLNASAPWLDYRDNITIISMDGVANIGNSAFKGYTWLQKVYFQYQSGSIVSDVNLSIGNDAFKDCVNLGSFYSGSSNILIGAGAFDNCLKYDGKISLSRDNDYNIGNTDGTIASGGIGDLYWKIHLNNLGADTDADDPDSPKSDNENSDNENSDNENTGDFGDGNGDISGNANAIARHSVNFHSDLCSDVELKIEWGWNLFSTDSYSYDNRLAIAGLILSAASQNGSSQCDNSLRSLEFGSTEHYNYGDFDGTGHSIAVRKVMFNDEIYNIFAVVIKGTTSIDDVINDIRQKGFTDSANTVYENLTKYMETYYKTNDKDYIKNQNNIFFVTGHSLGGASANLLGAKLSDYAERPKIYVYTTASPLTYSYKWNLRGLYNTVNYDDVVPHLSSAFFSHRIGEDRPFNRENWPNIYTAYEEITNGGSLHDAMGFWNSAVAIPRLLVAHDTAVYLSYLLVEDTGSWGLPYYFKRVSIRCPVDIEVCRGDVLVGKVVDNQIDPNVTVADVLITVDNDEKYVYMPFADQYAFKLIGTDDGTMEFALEEINSETGEIVVRKSFSDVILYDGKRMISETGGIIEPTDVKLYALDGKSEPVKEILSDGTEINVLIPPSDLNNNNQGESHNRPTGNVSFYTEKASDSASTEKDTSDTSESNAVTNPFTDISPSDWFYEGVIYTYANKLFNGTSANIFEPNKVMTRAMLATVLYRLAGMPTVNSANPFNDVENGQWYTDAILWVNNNNIAKGYGNGVFGANDPITREQLVTMLYDYAKFKSLEITNTKDISAFADAINVSDFALESVKWATAEQFIQGNSATTLNPKGRATRAEVAMVLTRFIKRFGQ